MNLVLFMSRVLFGKNQKLFDCSNNQRINLHCYSICIYVALSLKYIIHYGSVQY